jgi:Na+/melibiose symporter-like transporter
MADVCSPREVQVSGVAPRLAAPAPLLDPELLGRRRYRAGLLGGFLYQCGLLAISVVLLTYFQIGLDLSPQAAGIACLPVSVPLLAATWVAPLVKRFGARKVVTVGLVTGVLALVRQLGGAFGVVFLVTVATVMEHLRVDAIVCGLSSVEASDLESLLAGPQPGLDSLGDLEPAVE